MLIFTFKIRLFTFSKYWLKNWLDCWFTKLSLPGAVCYKLCILGLLMPLYISCRRELMNFLYALENMKEVKNFHTYRPFKKKKNFIYTAGNWQRYMLNLQGLVLVENLVLIGNQRGMPCTSNMLRSFWNLAMFIDVFVLMRYLNTTKPNVGFMQANWFIYLLINILFL